MTLESGEKLDSQHVILAIGHSARDTFQMLYDQGVGIEAKPFSIGFRIEHPQSIIDQARFGGDAGHPVLGAAGALAVCPSVSRSDSYLPRQNLSRDPL